MNAYVNPERVVGASDIMQLHNIMKEYDVCNKGPYLNHLNQNICCLITDGGIISQPTKTHTYTHNCGESICK